MASQSSIVIELQKLAAAEGAPVTPLLRKALIVATKLKLTEFKEWIENELTGFAGKKIPEYRTIPVELKMFNPFHGWQGVAFSDSRFAHAFQVRFLDAPIAELEQLVKNAGASLSLALIPEHFQVLQQMTSPIDAGYEMRQFLSRASVAGVIERVQTSILQWSLRLEEEGIVGEGMSFSHEEKELASRSPYISVGILNGVLGNVHGENVQIGEYGTIQQQVKDVGVSQSERNELENLLDELKTSKPEDKPSIMQRGMDWVGRNEKFLGSVASTIRKLFQPL